MTELLKVVIKVAIVIDRTGVNSTFFLTLIKQLPFLGLIQIEYLLASFTVVINI